MKYQKAKVEIMSFDNLEFFMTASGYNCSQVTNLADGSVCDGYSATPTQSYPNALHAISCNTYFMSGKSKPIPASPCPCVNSTTGNCYVYS